MKTHLNEISINLSLPFFARPKAFFSRSISFLTIIMKIEQKVKEILREYEQKKGYGEFRESLFSSIYKKGKKYPERTEIILPNTL
jgi:hypothetical protein